MIIGIDKQFANDFPAEIKQNATRINQKGGLKMDIDHNSIPRILQRIKRSKTSLLQVVFNILMNIWCVLITNFEVIFFNYFAPSMCIIVQMIGVLEQMEE